MEPDEIKATRKRLGLSQEAFAARLGTAQTIVSRWERGKNRPRKMGILMIQRVVADHERSIGEPEPVWITE